MEGSGPICLPTGSHLGQVVKKLQDYLSKKRIILISPGWPNMCWSWDLVVLSSQIPFGPYGNLPNRNIHAPRTSAIKEQGFFEAVAAGIDSPQESQSDQSMKQTGPFLQSGATVIRWTSGHPL